MNWYCEDEMMEVYTIKMKKDKEYYIMDIYTEEGTHIGTAVDKHYEKALIQLEQILEWWENAKTKQETKSNL